MVAVISGTPNNKISLFCTTVSSSVKQEQTILIPESWPKKPLDVNTFQAPREPREALRGPLLVSSNLNGGKHNGSLED